MKVLSLEKILEYIFSIIAIFLIVESGKLNSSHDFMWMYVVSFFVVFFYIILLIIKKMLVKIIKTAIVLIIGIIILGLYVIIFNVTSSSSPITFNIMISVAASVFYHMEKR